MKKYNVRIGDIHGIKSLAALAGSLKCDVDLSDGKHVVDGKFILGIFSLDLMNVLQLTIHYDDDATDKDINDFESKLKKYIV